jgi:Flp pilus assembly protein TadD
MLPPHRPREPAAMPIARTALLAAATAAALALAAPAARSADYGGSTQANDKLAPARAKLAEKNYPAALEELRRVNDARSADWNNLMGFALRKGPAPDLAAAERHYDEALRIDPRHKSALEYSGELYLMKGDLATAEQRLATLDKVCFVTCAEKRDLAKAIEAYKANGNRHVPS